MPSFEIVANGTVVRIFSDATRQYVGMFHRVPGELQLILYRVEWEDRGRWEIRKNRLPQPEQAQAGIP